MDLMETIRSLRARRAEAEAGAAEAAARMGALALDDPDAWAEEAGRARALGEDAGRLAAAEAEAERRLEAARRAAAEAERTELRRAAEEAASLLEASAEAFEGRARSLGAAFEEMDRLAGEARSAAARAGLSAGGLASHGTRATRVSAALWRECGPLMRRLGMVRPLGAATTTARTRAEGEKA